MPVLAANLAPASHPGPLRRRLRRAGFGVALFVATLAVGLHLAGPETSPFRHTFGDDLVPSYMAGAFVLDGRPDKLMDYAAAEQFQADLRASAGLAQHGRTGPWLNPPFFAALFVPLAALPYRAALWTWFGLNAAMLAGSVTLLYRMLPPARRSVGDGVAIALLLVASMPGLQALACQQNTFLSLLILCGAVTLVRANQPVLAGAVAGLLLFKPQLAVILGGALFVTHGWRAAAGTALTGGTLLLATALFMPGAMPDYLHRLPAVLPYLRTGRPYFWERQATFLGFWRLLLYGRTGGPNPPVAVGLWLACAAPVAGLLARPMWTALRRGVAPADRDRLLAAAVAAAPLLMPYYMDYDLLLLAVPAVLLATGRMAGDRGHDASGWDWPTVAWTALYGWLFVNAAVGDTTGWSMTVPLLAVAAGTQMIRGVGPPGDDEHGRKTATMTTLCGAGAMGCGTPLPVVNRTAVL